MEWAIFGMKELRSMKLNIIVLLLAVLLCLVTVIACRYYITITMNRLSRIITSFLSKKEPDYTEVAETRESKLASQLRQLLSITAHNERLAREEKEAVLSLISDLSHQLKTPLANITMYTELLKDTTLCEEERQEFLLRTADQAAKMEWLMKTLLKTSRLEVGMIEFEVSANNIKETIANSISTVYAQAERKRIQISIDHITDQRLLHNPKWTAEAISNILENAIKYSPEASQITITLEPMELYTRLNIIDQGIGIAPEEYNLIFKRFFRSKQVEQLEGSGLGLYLAQLILSKEDGYITVNSQLGKGSCFSLYLQNVRE
jgi:signal transduction histidine kinase